MPILTEGQISELYDKYSNIDVIFTKELNDFIRLERKSIFLKLKNEQRPCIIYSSSMREAKVIVSMNLEHAKVVKSNNLTTLKLCFLKKENSDIISFFVQSRIVGLSLYAKRQNLFLAQLGFIRKPPDYFIETLGNIIEININSIRRKNDKIPVSRDSMQFLDLDNRMAVLSTKTLSCNAIINSISFYGIELLVPNNSEFISYLYVEIKIKTSLNHVIPLKGSIRGTHRIPEDKKIVLLEIQLDKDSVDYEYKSIINNYLNYTLKI